MLVEQADRRRDPARLERAGELPFHAFVVRGIVRRADAAGQLGLTEVEDGEGERLRFPRNVRRHRDGGNRHTRAAGAEDVEVVALYAVAVDVRVVVEVVE